MSAPNQTLVPYTEPVAPVRLPGPPVPWQTWDGMIEFCQICIDSHLVPPHVKTWQAALLIIQTGLELRIGPTQALAGIYFFEGKVTLSARLMIGIIKRDHGGDAIRVLESTDKKCTIAYKRRDASEGGTYTWTIEQAQAAGLLAKDNWKKYPASMLRARALSAVAAFEFPDLIGGLVTPEELGAQVRVTSAGDVVIDGDAYAATSIPRQITAQDADGEQRPATPMHIRLADLLAQTWHDMTGERPVAVPRDADATYLDTAITQLMELIVKAVQPEDSPLLSAEQQQRLTRAKDTFRQDYNIHLTWPDNLRAGGVDTLMGILTKAKHAPARTPIEAAN